MFFIILLKQDEKRRPFWREGDEIAISDKIRFARCCFNPDRFAFTD